MAAVRHGYGTSCVPLALLAFLVPVTGSLGPAPPAAVDCLPSPHGHEAVPLVETRLAEVDATLRTLHALYAGMPGFLDVYFQPADGPDFRPTFVGEVPDEARAAAAPVPVTFELLVGKPMPVGPGTVPTTEDVVCKGIRPGSRISTGIGICTLAWILTDGTNTYAATAGHCVASNGAVSVDRVGVIGRAVKSTGDAGVGNDFAFIKIDAAKLSLVSPEMCDVAGPKGLHSSGPILGAPTWQTGHGLGVTTLIVTETPPRLKDGVGLGWGVQSFTWLGTSVPGDSGSPLRLAGNGNAVGIVTHILGNVNYGTSLTWAIANSGIPNLQLVTVPYTHP